MTGVGSGERQREAGGLTRPPLDDAAMRQLFLDARSPKAWRAGQHIPEGTIGRLYDLVRLGPTSNNGSPLRLAFAVSPEARAALIGALHEGNRKKVEGAGLICVAGYEPTFWRNWERLSPHKNMTALLQDAPASAEAEAQESCLLQIGYLILAGRALGLDVLPLRGFDHEAMRDTGLLPQGCVPVLVCCFGQGDTGAMRPRAARLERDEAVVVR